MDFRLVFVLVVAFALLFLETIGTVAWHLLKLVVQAVLIALALAIRLQKRFLIWAAESDPGVLAFLVLGIVFYLALPAYATCHGDDETLVCGAGGLCDLTPNLNMKFVAFNTDLNPPSVGTLNYYFPNLQVSFMTL